MAKKKKDITFASSVRKDKAIMARIPEEYMPNIKKLLVKYEIKTLQELFDYLVVSGVVFRKKEILELVKDKREKWQQDTTKRRMGNLGKGPKIPKQKMYCRNFSMYNSDFKAFKDFLIEENIKQQHVWNVLFIDGFHDEDPRAIKVVTKGRDLEVTKRKKAVARLLDDEYIQILPEQDAKEILSRLTKEYDNREFDDEIQNYISEIMSEEIKELDEEAQIEAELNAKLTSLRRSRGREVAHIVEPVEHDEK